MIRTKLGLLGLCAVVVGMMAMSVSAAQGATLSWLVLNAAKTVATNLKAEVLGKKDSEHLTLLTKLVGIKVAITCTNFALNGVFIEPVEKVSAGGRVVFTGCEAYENNGTVLGPNLKCEVSTAGTAIGTIESNKGVGLLELHTLAGGGTEVLTKIEPEVAGGPFATILLKKCVLPESNKVNGVLFVKDCLGFATTHKTEHLIVQGPLTSLFVGLDTVEHLETSIDGSAWIRLGGAHVGLDWSAMDV